MVVTGIPVGREGLLSMVAATQPEIVAGRALAKKVMPHLVNDLHRLEFHPKVIVLSPDPQTAAATWQPERMVSSARVLRRTSCCPSSEACDRLTTLVSTDELTDVDASQRD